MELEYDKTVSGKKSLSETGAEGGIIKVRANISCPSCGMNKKFKNQFHQKNIESMIVSLKVLDWLTCSKCGELMNLNLEFEI